MTDQEPNQFESTEGNSENQDPFENLEPTKPDLAGGENETPQFNQINNYPEFRGPGDDISDQDKLMGLLSYVIPLIVPLIVLFSETGKQRRFQRYHAVHSLIISGILVLFGLIIVCPITVGVSMISAGIGSCCTVPFALIPYIIGVVYGIQAYGGRYSEIPLVTNLAKSQGWV